MWSSFDSDKRKLPSSNVRDEFSIKLITQLYFENHPLNESDFLFKKMNPEEKKINTLILDRKFDKKNTFTSNFQLIL